MSWDPFDFAKRRSCGNNVNQFDYGTPPHFKKNLNLDIYQWVNDFLLKFMTPVEEENNKFLYETIDATVPNSPNFYFLKEDFYQHENQGIYGLVYTLSKYFCFLSFFFTLALILRWVFTALGFRIPNLRETKPRLAIRAGVYVFLFSLLLTGTIFVDLLLKDMEKTDETISKYKDFIHAKSQAYHQNFDKTCPFTKSELNRESIEAGFNELREKILNHCLNQDEPMYDFDGYKKEIQHTLEKTVSLMKDLKDLEGYTEAHNEEREEIEELSAMFLDLKDSLEDLLPAVDDFESTDSDWRKKSSAEYNKTNRLLQEAFNPAQKEALALVSTANRYSDYFGNVTLRVSLWMNKLADFSTRIVKNGVFDSHQEIAEWLPKINRTTLVLPLAIGLAFLVLPYFGTFCKLMSLTGKSKFRRTEAWAGRIFYMTFVYFALTTCLFSLIFLKLSESAIPARSICAIVGDGDNFETDWKKNFYSQEVFEKIDRPIRPKLVRSGENLRTQISIGDAMNFPEADHIFTLENVFNVDPLQKTIFKAKHEIEIILRNVKHHDEEDISSVLPKEIQEAVDALKLTGERDGYLSKVSEKMGLSRLLAKEIKKFLDEINGRSWTPSKSMIIKQNNGPDILFPISKATQREHVSQAIRAEGCELHNPEKFDNLLKSIEEKATIVSKYLREQFKTQDMRVMLNDNNEMLCRIISEPLSTLFFFTVINTIIWVFCMLTILRTAISWNQTEEKVNLLESLAAPLIEDEKKTEEGAYDNSLSDLL